MSKKYKGRHGVAGHKGHVFICHCGFEAGTIKEFIGHIREENAKL